MEDLLEMQCIVLYHTGKKGSTESLERMTRCNMGNQCGEKKVSCKFSRCTKKPTAPKLLELFSESVKGCEVS